MAGDGETAEEVTVWDLATGRVQESVEIGRDAGHKEINQQAPSDGGTVGGPL